MGESLSGKNFNSRGCEIDNLTIISEADSLPSICTLAGAKIPGDIYDKIDSEDMPAAFLGKLKQRTKSLI
jgi:hypothetical protein